MADISLGTFEVTSLQKMTNLSDPALSTYSANFQQAVQVGQRPQPGPVTLPVTVWIQNLGVLVAGFVPGEITLGEQYEVILREVV